MRNVRRCLVLPISLVVVLAGSLAGAAGAAPAEGWSREELLDSGVNDWEPAIAADPSGPYIYVLRTRYGGPKACPTCADPVEVLQVSSDYGRTWSEDGGETWRSRRMLSAGEPGVRAVFPAAVGMDEGDFRIWFMDDRTGLWNTWYRASDDGGKTWTEAVRVSDASSGAPYKHLDGFSWPYGDYGEIDIDAQARTVAVWGEAAAGRPGPGGVWFNRERR